MITRFLDPKNDVAFKKIFGTEKNKGLLLSFLNEVLGNQIKQKIKDLKFLKTEQDPETAAKKQSIVDVLCIDQKGVQHIVEMQIAKAAGFEKRAQYYASKAYLNQLNKGKEHKYENLKEVIFLAITDYEMFPKKKAYKSDHATLDKETYEQDLDGFSFTFVELPKFQKALKASKKKLKDLTLEEKWYYFLSKAPETKEENLAQLTSKDIIIKQAYTALDRFGWSDKELFTYEQEVKRVMDNEAVERQKLMDAKVEGKAERNIEIARTMLTNDMPVETIAKITGLDQQAFKRQMNLTRVFKQVCRQLHNLG